MISTWITAYIGLGANLGQPARQIEKALWELHHSDGVRVLAVSRFYRSKALLVSQAPPQPDYINAVAKLRTSLPARCLLNRLQRIERKLGRTRIYRWAPRTLDLDLLLYGHQKIQKPDLIVPHKEIHKRAFVLYPLHDIAPDLILPELGPLQKLLRYCDTSGLHVKQDYRYGRISG
jgi:2-amino-4-hydroxy-6-hydroxymethyldihydropteridine diphosphokinase